MPIHAAIAPHDKGLRLVRIKRTDPRILKDMENHYSQPRGFVGRNICYAVMFDGLYYGAIVGGSATLHLPNRHEFLGTRRESLNNIVNNIFFHIEKRQGKYPMRNFAQRVLREFRHTVVKDWYEQYGDVVVGFETLVELPRTGEVYLRDGWTLVGQTTGYTCKRTGGTGTDGWSGKRVWDTKNLRPKAVLCRLVSQPCAETQPIESISTPCQNQGLSANSLEALQTDYHFRYS